MIEDGLDLPLSPLQVLLVEDDPDLRSSLTDVLLDEGYEVVAVPSGNDAIQQASEREFDLIVTDIKMPGTDGLTALEHVKMGNPAVAGIIITGYSTEDSALRAARLKVESYLQKPFRVHEFLAAVDKLAVSKRQAQAKLAQDLSMQWGLRWLSRELVNARASGVDLERWAAAASTSGLTDSRDPREQLAAETALLWETLRQEGLELPRRLFAALPERLAQSLLNESTANQGLSQLAQTLLSSSSEPDSYVEAEAVPLEGSLLNVALLLESAGRTAEARQAFLEVIQKTQEPSRLYPAHFGLARLARQSRDYAELEGHLSAGAAAAASLGPLSHCEALTERGILLSLAARDGANEALLRAQQAAKEVKDTSSFALCGLALSHFHGVETPRRPRLLAYLHQPEHFTTALPAAGWLLAYLFAHPLQDEERRFLQKLARSAPRSFHLLALQCDDSEVAARMLDVLHLAPSETQQAALARFATLASPELRRSCSRWQSQAQDQATQHTSILRIFSFSGMQLFRDDEAQDMKRRKPLLLLLYLLYRNAPVGEETLLELFWPGDERPARVSLRAAMSYLRKLLAPDSPLDPFERRPNGISLAKNLAIWFDYREFENLIAQGQQHRAGNPQRAVECFRAAVKLCRGPFLENVYEDWAVAAREHTETSLTDALRYLTEQCLATQAWAEAYEHGSRALRHDDLSQPFYEVAMRALIELDRQHEAIALYEQGKTRLFRELELEPSIEMMRLRELARLNV